MPNANAVLRPGTERAGHFFWERSVNDFFWVRSVDNTAFGLFLLATFIGGVTTGLAGFAMGLVVSGIWLHIIAPIQTATLIAGYGLLTQSYGIWKLRHALR